MKSFIISFCLILSLFSLTSFSVYSPTSVENSDNQLIGIATGAIRSNCDVQGDIKGYVFYNSEYGRCANGESFKRVVFYQLPSCPPNQPCIQIIRYIGEVILDCDNNVFDVECGGFITL